MTGRAYDVFVSYGHKADERFVDRFRHWLEKLARSPRQGRALRVFDDHAAMNGSPDLERTITAGLDQSDWLILLASPGAAGSDWVNDEVSWWLRNRGPETLLIALTEGHIAWDQSKGRFDGETDAVPPVLRGGPDAELRFDVEPRFVDLRDVRKMWWAGLWHPRVRDKIAELAAPVHGLKKDDLVGAHLVRTRIQMAVLGVLLSALVVAAFVAWDLFEDQTTDRLVSSALDAVQEDVVRARLLAVEAYERDPGPRAYGALVRAMTGDQDLVATTRMGDKVLEVVGARDGRHVVGITAAPVMIDGEPMELGGGGTALARDDQGRAHVRFLRWDTATGNVSRSGPAGSLTLDLDQSPRDLATSQDGTSVVVADDRQILLWRDGVVRARKFATGQIAAVGISPDGDRIGLITIAESRKDEPARLFVLSAADLSQTEAVRLPGTEGEIPSSYAYGVALPSSEDVVVLAGPDVGWRSFRITDDGLVLGHQSGAQVVDELASRSEIEYFRKEKVDAQGNQSLARRVSDAAEQALGTRRIVSEHVTVQARSDNAASAAEIGNASGHSERWPFEGVAYASTIGGRKAEPTWGPVTTSLGGGVNWGAQDGGAQISDNGRLLLLPEAGSFRVVELTERGSTDGGRLWDLPALVSEGRGAFLGSQHQVVTVRDDEINLWDLGRVGSVTRANVEPLLSDTLATAAELSNDHAPPALAAHEDGRLALVTAEGLLIVISRDHFILRALPDGFVTSLPVWTPGGRLILVQAAGGIGVVDTEKVLAENVNFLRPIAVDEIRSPPPDELGRCGIVAAASAQSESEIVVVRACGNATTYAIEDGRVLRRYEQPCTESGVLGTFMASSPSATAFDAESLWGHRTWLTELDEYAIAPDASAAALHCWSPNRRWVSHVSVLNLSDGVLTALPDTEDTAYTTVRSVAVAEDQILTSNDVSTYPERYGPRLALFDTSIGELVTVAARPGAVADGVALVPGTTFAMYPRVDTEELVVVDLSSGDVAVTLPVAFQETDRIYQVGSRVISFSVDGGVSSWDLRPPTLLRRACESASRDLTHDEWTDAVGWAPAPDLRCGRA